MNINQKKSLYYGEICLHVKIGGGDDDEEEEVGIVVVVVVVISVLSTVNLAMCVTVEYHYCYITPELQSFWQHISRGFKSHIPIHLELVIQCFSSSNINKTKMNDMR
jgi:hypothetical protein